MKNKQFLIMAMVVTLAGFVGGMLGYRAFSSQTALAQEGEEGAFLASRAFQLQDGNGNARIIMTTKQEDNMPMIGFYEANGNPRLVLALSENGEPVVSMLDGNGTLRAATVALDKEGATVELYDENGQTIWNAPK